MPLPLALLPFLPAIAAGTGAVAKGAQRYGPSIVQGGINTLNRYANPVLNKIFNSQIGVPIQQQTPSVLGGAAKAITPTFASQYFNDPKQAITDAGYFSGADDASKLITGEGESGFLEDLGIFDAVGALIDKITGNNSKDKKEDKKEDKKDKKDKKKKKETKENKEPSIDDLPLDAEEAKKKKNLKKGGYVKKQRKRKPYKSSSFAKMKKSKKRKYI